MTSLLGHRFLPASIDLHPRTKEEERLTGVIDWREQDSSLTRLLKAKPTNFRPMTRFPGTFFVAIRHSSLMLVRNILSNTTVERWGKEHGDRDHEHRVTGITIPASEVQAEHCIGLTAIGAVCST